jgi:hypothetical protein
MPSPKVQSESHKIKTRTPFLVVGSRQDEDGDSNIIIVIYIVGAEIISKYNKEFPE